MHIADDLTLQLFVNRLNARSVLTAEEQSAILALPKQLVHLRPRQDFVLMNEELSYSCYIASGIVGRFGQTASGARQTTAFHIPGDMADLNSAVRPIGLGGLNSLCHTTIFRIPHTAIRCCAARYPAVAEAFWRDCMLDSAILLQWVVNVGRRDAKTRLAHIFCEMAIRSGDDRQILHSYVFRVTQEQLADAAALTPVHVNRTLKSLRDIVTLKDGRVTIHDWQRLCHIGDFDASYLTADTAPERQKRLLEPVRVPSDAAVA